MQTFCGLDFGTSNTTIGVSSAEGCQLVPLEGKLHSIRSAIFCDEELKKWVFGQQGIDLYLEGVPGRLMMAIKSVLGSSLMDDSTVIFNELISYKKILGNFIAHIKTTAEHFTNTELTQVVMGRPVRFHDSDKEQDKVAQATLEEVAREVGFKDVIFQYEPIAAALTYEMSIQSEQLALIVDMGGGTSDFTVIRLRPGTKRMHRVDDVLANAGIHIAGTDFDQRISLKTVMPLLGMGSSVKSTGSDLEMPSGFYHDLTTWHTLNSLYSNATLAQVRSLHAMAYRKDLISRLIHVLRVRAGHHILDAVEKSKQLLSEELNVLSQLDFIESELNAPITRDLLNAVIENDVERILQTIRQTISDAGVKFTDISAIFYTGGSTKIPAIREKINSLFPQATIVQGDAFGSVGLGLAIDAQRRYGPL